jgi:Homeodomain-like domain
VVAAAGVRDGRGEPRTSVAGRMNTWPRRSGLRAKVPWRLRLERSCTCDVEIGKRLGRKSLQDVASVAKPDTILAWYRKLVARKFDGSKNRQYPGRPRIKPEVEALVVQMTRENSGWGYDRIIGALANLGHRLSDRTVGNIMRRHGIAPAPKRGQTTSWRDFIASHMSVLGTVFFTVEVLTWQGLVTWLESPDIPIKSGWSRPLWSARTPSTPSSLMLGVNGWFHEISEAGSQICLLNLEELSSYNSRYLGRSGM